MAKMSVHSRALKQEEIIYMKPLNLTPEQALGVALSTGPMSNEIMDVCQQAAIPMVDHLGRMGFHILKDQ